MIILLTTLTLISYILSQNERSHFFRMFFLNNKMSFFSPQNCSLPLLLRRWNKTQRHLLLELRRRRHRATSLSSLLLLLRSQPRGRGHLRQAGLPELLLLRHVSGGRGGEEEEGPLQGAAREANVSWVVLEACSKTKKQREREKPHEKI